MSTTVSSKQALNLGQLKKLSNEPNRIVTDLFRVLLTMADPIEETRAWAADCLQAVEEIDVAKAEEIAPLCEHESEFVVYWTLTMLGKSGNVNAYQTQLTQALINNPSTVVRQAAASVLRQATAATAETRAALEQAATSRDPRLKRLAEQALAEVG
jgi:hypothetical protein